uniref:Uncharacterized protein n=1 Tax=Daucus carota subsp. sativus TaxID=79200 RepID=A0A161ZQM4_DAUCS
MATLSSRKSRVLLSDESERGYSQNNSARSNFLEWERESSATDSCYVWQFNCKEFDIEKDLSNFTSIKLLKQQGIDFVKNKQQGISAVRFSKWFFQCFGPGRRFYNPTENLNITWISFHGTYDFAYLLSVITLDKLPNDLNTFARLLRYYFGDSVYDLKVILKFQGLHGGLKRMAEIVGVDRVAGNHHQAGSDSLLTMQMFMEMKKNYFCGKNFGRLSWFRYMLFGLNFQILREIYVPCRARIAACYQRFY